jgi:hypothetical protein
MRAIIEVKTWDGKNDQREVTGFNVADCLNKVVPALDTMSDHVSMEWTTVQITITRPVPFSRSK